MQQPGPFGTFETLLGNYSTTVEQQRAGVGHFDTEYTAYTKVMSARQATLLTAGGSGPFRWRLWLNVLALCLIAYLGYYLQKTDVPRPPIAGWVDLTRAPAHSDDDTVCNALLAHPRGTLDVQPHWHVAHQYSFCQLVNGPQVYVHLASAQKAHQNRLVAALAGALLFLLLINILTRKWKLRISLIP